MEYQSNYNKEFGIKELEDELFCQACDNMIIQAIVDRFSIEYWSMILSTMALAVEYDAPQGTLDGMNRMCEDMHNRGIAIVRDVERFKSNYIVIMMSAYKGRWSREDFENRMNMLLEIGARAIDRVLESRINPVSIRIPPDAGVNH